MSAKNLVEVTVPMPEAGISEGAQKLLAHAEALRIVTSQDYEVAGAALLALNKRQGEVEAMRVALKRPVDQAAAAIQALFKPPLDVFDRAKAILKRKIGNYAQEQERLRREEQRKAEEKARKERERLEEQARKAEASGKTEKAAQLEQRASTVVAPVISREPPKVAGIQLRETWLFEITDPSLVPREYLVVDESRVRKVVGALKKDCNIPGVRVWSEMKPAAGAAA